MTNDDCVSAGRSLPIEGEAEPVATHERARAPTVFLLGVPHVLAGRASARATLRWPLQ